MTKDKESERSVFSPWDDTLELASPAQPNKFFPVKVKAPARELGSIVRRTDFDYMNGRGTFYRFDEEHFPQDLLAAENGERVSVVLYNLHTDQLDEVVFILRSKFKVGEKSIFYIGRIADIDDYFEIKIEYYLNRPLKSYILVFASGAPAKIIDPSAKSGK